MNEDKNQQNNSSDDSSGDSGVLIIDHGNHKKPEHHVPEMVNPTEPANPVGADPAMQGPVALQPSSNPESAQPPLVPSEVQQQETAESAPVQDQQPAAEPAPYLDAHRAAQAAEAEQELHQDKPMDVLGMIGIGMALVAVTPVGLVMGFLGIRKARQKGLSSKLSLLAIVLNVIMIFVTVGLVVTLTSQSNNKTQQAEYDTEGIADLNAIADELEIYYFTNLHYPSDFNESTFPELDPEVFNAPNDEKAYVFEPQGCEDEKCSSFVLSYKLKSESSPNDLDGDGFYSIISIN